ncbi:hypothetical protein FTE28_17550 [Bacillus licheniformis]|uniref:hypothetical protein n=1 Tax=Bacillus licheniformis TaxID=1402 RepID=UPI0011AA2BF6|nr:hypothetical protein [Bacillus licheniformis]MED1024558.1 hypothetical protein [Bacillus licheniformis]MED1033090.1 hypothetical protein [Bacillus licheniformis]MED1102408.1 hypothetical protein [Bacillus licheniformis]MED1142413.1 hypothetical protein [Bacillus licheniformis]QNT74108.1 hypothetical protein FTE28_17550 [Bacillus licheniformis]
MKFVFTVSQLKKGSEIREDCKKMKENPALLLLVEADIRRALEMKKQQASTLTASTKDVVNSL